MRIVHQQYGLTPLSTMTILALVGFCIVMVMKLAPVYIENYSVSSSLKSLKQDLEIRDKNPDQMYESLKRRFDINDVRHVRKDNVKITRASGIVTVDVKYNVAVPLVGNVSLLVDFANNITF